jgi:malate dehydrogenase (oxaloacetate-decarboxylating)(NADP+)
VGLAEHKLPYADAPISDFLTAIRTLKLTAIVGVAAAASTFTPKVLGAMAEFNTRPILFALSNPTSKSECTAEEAYRYTAGRALFACGSPYHPMTLNGKTFMPRQGNNSYVFPGIELGAIASGARRITDEMFIKAAYALAKLIIEDDLAQGSLYSALPRIREVSASIATEGLLTAAAWRSAESHMTWRCTSNRTCINCATAVTHDATRTLRAVQALRWKGNTFTR